MGTDTEILETAYLVRTDHEIKIEEIIKSDRFAWCFDNKLKLEDFLNTKVFPPTRRGKSFENIRFIPAKDLESFHWSEMNISIKEILAELDKLGYRAVEIRELLAFGNAFFHLQTKNPIIALGSIGIIKEKIKIATGLCCRDMKATAIVICPEEYFSMKCFLAVIDK